MSNKQNLREIDEKHGAAVRNRDDVDDENNRQQLNKSSIKTKGDNDGENDTFLESIQQQSQEKSDEKVKTVSKPSYATVNSNISHSKEAGAFCLNLKCSVNIDPDKRPTKPYYHTCCCKRGLLCIVQLGTEWEDENAKDKAVLEEFFCNTLGFDKKDFTSYGALEEALKQDKTDKMCLEKYYCLVICISGHGDENGVIIEDEIRKIEEGKTERVNQWKTTNDIKRRFGNEKIPTLAGVPKIIILDVCRGNVNNIAMRQPCSGKKGNEDVLPTKSSDFLFIHATTNGHTANIPHMYGSVGIQGVMEALKKNWENEHLEEMLIDARMNVAKWKDEDIKDGRQTLETQSTLTKRLMFEKFVV